MDMQALTPITLADELATQGLSHTTIATHLGRHRETIGPWLRGGRLTGWPGFSRGMHRPRRGPDERVKSRRRSSDSSWALRIREPECCGQKIAYFLEWEHQFRRSVPKIYETLAEQYVIRSKWRKNQKRGAVPTASGPRVVIQMDTVALGGVFAFTGIDIYTKEGAVYLQTAMAHRFTGRVAVLQTDRGLECKSSFAQQARAYCDRHRIARPYKKNEPAYIESFNRTLRKEGLGWGSYRVEDLPP